MKKRAQVLVLGAGIAGLSAARAFTRAGIDDVQILELENTPGGNSRGHNINGVACPLGAHYLPLPGAQSHEVREWLFEIGLLRSEFGRTVADEKSLCHSPQERLFFEGTWVEGLLPPAPPSSATADQYRRFAALVAQQRGYAIPTHRTPWSAVLADLDRITFTAWLAQQGLNDAHLLWYLDYCCRDDYGAPSSTVSAWAGLHYFASRHGFHAPGDESGERDAVFTWPEGNAWLVAKLAAPLRTRLHAGRTVLRVAEERHAVQVLAWDEGASQVESWTAQTVVMALPLFVAARIIESPTDALRNAAASLSYAPWLVANLQLDKPLLDRPGAALAWDNVCYGSSGLGYVNAQHQSLRPDAAATVLTAYHAVPQTQRQNLLTLDWRAWAEQVVNDLLPAHPDLRQRIQRIDLMRYGHAMSIPTPGVRSNTALQSLRQQRGRLRFAHADLAGYSIFEEAFTAGCEVARPR